MSYVHITVHSSEVLGDIETDELQKELKSRFVTEPHPLQAIADAFKLGQPERATELARSFVSEQLGVIL